MLEVYFKVLKKNNPEAVKAIKIFFFNRRETKIWKYYCVLWYNKSTKCGLGISHTLWFFCLKLPLRDCLDHHYICLSKSIHFSIIPLQTEPPAAPEEHSCQGTAGEDVPETMNYMLRQLQEQQIAVQKEPVGLHWVTVAVAGGKQQNEMSAQANLFPFGSLFI